MKEVDLYSFVYRGVSSEEALDRAGRRRRNHFSADQVREIQSSLSFDFLDPQLLAEAQCMSAVYAAIHAFENTVRSTVVKAMGEKHGPMWWEKVPERIRKVSKTRMEEELTVSLARRTRSERNQLLRLWRSFFHYRYELGGL